jgi:DNA-binding NtrC family response regulator
VVEAGSGDDALDLLGRENCVLALCDIRMPGMGGLEFLGELKRRQIPLTVIMMSAYGSIDTAIECMKQGAYDYISKPFKPDEVVLAVRKAEERLGLQMENERLKQELASGGAGRQMVFASETMARVMSRVRQVAGSASPVLITGETGTGKELVARALHAEGGRRHRPFVAVNCSAIASGLLESELFGHMRGAFTGADRERQGLFGAADGGTLFLDEIGNLPMNVQKTLLRFLQEQEFLRLGDTKPTKVDVRVISATNSDLMTEIKAGTFREDLYYRFNVVNIHLPPLRERRTDIPLLAAHFIKLQNEKFGTRIRGLSPEAFQAACDYAWPGNIRQLRNVIEACMAIENGEWISLPVLSQFIDIDSTPPREVADGDSYSAALSRFETSYLIGLLKKTAGNIDIAAREAGMNMATIYRKLKKYDIKKDDYS